MLRVCVSTEALPVGYLAVTGSIYVVGFLLVECGHRLGA